MKKKGITVTIARHPDVALGKPNQIIQIVGAGDVAYTARDGATRYYRVGDWLLDADVDELAAEDINLVVTLKNR